MLTLHCSLPLSPRKKNRKGHTAPMTKNTINGDLWYLNFSTKRKNNFLWGKHLLLPMRPASMDCNRSTRHQSQHTSILVVSNSSLRVFLDIIKTTSKTWYPKWLFFLCHINPLWWLTLWVNLTGPRWCPGSWLHIISGCVSTPRRRCFHKRPRTSFSSNNKRRDFYLQSLFYHHLAILLKEKNRLNINNGKFQLTGSYLIQVLFILNHFITNC